MNFHDMVPGKARALKMPIHVRSEREGPVFHPFRPPAQDVKSVVRLRVPIQIQAMAIKAPRQGRVVSKPAGIGQGDEIEAEFLIRRISIPKALIAAEIRQAGINSHAGTGADQNRLGPSDSAGCALYGIFIHFKLTLVTWGPVSHLTNKSRVPCFRGSLAKSWGSVRHRESMLALQVRMLSRCHCTSSFVANDLRKHGTRPSNYAYFWQARFL